MCATRVSANTSNSRLRGQSEVVGVLLLTGVMVVAVGLIGLFILSGVDTEQEPAVQIDIDVANSTYTISHLGGDNVPTDGTRVVLSGDVQKSKLLADLSERKGDGDGSFEGGEIREGGHTAGNILTVTVVHEATNSVLARVSRDVPSLTKTALTWETATDWDAASASSGVVHESYGDRTADRVELGYPSDGPMAFWALDEDSGSTIADVAGSNDGTLEDGTLGVGGITGTSSVDFDGTDDYVSGATDIPALRNTASISVWVNTTTTGDATMWQAPGLTGVESAGDGNDIFWGWIDDQGRIGVQAGDQAGAVSADPINDGDWHHVVLTRNASTGRVEVYVDGSLSDGATSRTGEITTSFDSIGRIEDTAGTPEYFPGRIEEMQVYDRVLDAETVERLNSSATNGSLTTGGKTFSSAVNASNLRLTDVSVTRPSEITVRVESDPGRDGNFEETSDPIQLDGSGSHQVTGLNSPSQTFRLRVEFDSPDVATSPTFDAATLDVTG